MKVFFTGIFFSPTEIHSHTREMSFQSQSYSFSYETVHQRGSIYVFIYLDLAFELKDLPV